MALPTFNWIGNQAVSTPEAAARQRAVAEALIGQSSTPASNWAEGLGDIAAAFTGTQLQSRADEAEAAGRESAAAALAGIGPNAGFSDIASALSNPWLSQPQSTIAAALLQQNLERQDPMYQMGLERAQLELDALRSPQPETPDYPTSVQEYLYAQNDPGFAAWQAENGGGQTINVGGQPANIGTIPPGYAAVEDPTSPAGYRFEVIPNSAAEAEANALNAKGESASSRRDLATDIITGAASKARDALTSGGLTTGIPGAVTANLPDSQAAELRRQIDVLKANATIENLTAMRQASPTGGALGSVTEKEGAMLAAASGAIDPNASYEQVAAAIDNYERVLLQVVHGVVDGERIYQETRNTAPATDAGWQDFGGVRIREIQ